MPDPVEKTYQVSGPGEAAQKKHRSEFETLLRTDALTLMRKRGSMTLDETDFGHAYGRLLESDSKNWRREAAGEFGVFSGGAILAYGTTLALETEKTPGGATTHPELLPGLLLVVAGLV